MTVILNIFVAVFNVLLSAVSLAMFVRMLLPLFTGNEESNFALFLACVTEPFVAPVRFLLVKFNILQGSPIDWSFTIAYILIALLRAFLPAI